MRAVGIDDVPGHRRETAVGGVAAREDVVAQTAVADHVHRKGQDVRRPQPGQMLVHRQRLPARVGEDRAVRRRRDVSVRGHQSQRRQLHAGAERKHAQAGLLLGHRRLQGTAVIASNENRD